MNALSIIIIANIAATFVIFCGLKLFDMGSDLAEIIRKYGVFLGVIFAFVAVFNFLLKDTFDIYDDKLVVPVVMASMVSFAILGFLAELAKHHLLKQPEPAKKKAKRTVAQSPAGIKLASLGAIDLVFGVLAGAATGVSFTLNNGTGIMVLCAFILLQVVDKVATIHRYQEASLVRGQIIAILATTFCASTVVSILLALFARENYRHFGIFMAMAIGYIGYICIYHLVRIVKKYQK